MSVLTQLGLGDIGDEERKKYLPRLVHQIEYRLGAALLPLVPDSAAPEFEKLLDADADAQTWLDFWKRSLPNFEDEVKKVLANFAKECQTILA